VVAVRYGTCGARRRRGARCRPTGSTRSCGRESRA